MLSEVIKELQTFVFVFFFVFLDEQITNPSRTYGSKI